MYCRRKPTARPSRGRSGFVAPSHPGTTTAWSWFLFFSSRRRHTRSLCDWSSDVCSSDLGPHLRDAVDELVPTLLGGVRVGAEAAQFRPGGGAAGAELQAAAGENVQHRRALGDADGVEIGRASCRERVEISGGAVGCKTKS